MGAAVGTGDGKKSVNVDLNIVPFIDLMSCLTAFLLVAAVWVNIAQLDIRPKGKSRDTSQQQIDDERVVLSILVQSDKIYLTISRVNDYQEISRKGTSEDEYWKQFAAALRDKKTGTYFNDRTDLEIAGESTNAGPVNYQDIIKAMDLAVQAGFIDVGLTDPSGLAARPTL
jgi:biopolymer transport protein ExbD